MKPIPMEYGSACAHAGTMERLDYGEKFLLLYTPTKPAKRVLYLIHGGGGMPGQAGLPHPRDHRHKGHCLP